MTLNSIQFAAIIETAKAKAANSPKWVRAIDRAAAALQSGELVVTLLAHDALVTSANGSYRVNGHCECEASRRGHAECYHRAAVRLVELLESEPVATKAATRDADITYIKRAWPKSWPPLAIELMARFRKNQLEMLDDDMLRRVRLAVAM
jgi:hypothetical protein